MNIHHPDFDDLTLIDTGASPSISLYKMDVVGTITPLPEPRTLGDMSHGTPISDFGIVQWILQTGATTITIYDNCYHVPNDRSHLIFPHQLFSACGRSTGTFTIDDKSTTLSLDGKQSLQILNDSKSYVYIAISHNTTASDYPIEVNMSVLYEENKN